MIMFTPLPEQKVYALQLYLIFSLLVLMNINKLSKILLKLSKQLLEFIEFYKHIQQ